MRLDVYLTENNYFKSRNKAQEEIKNGHVMIDKKLILKPNYEYEFGEIEIVNPLRYVSRGGLKLEEAISAFNIDFSNKVVLDIGSSTGGFTDCAIQHGAKKVYSVDVGTDQMDNNLKKNPKVVLMEGTNILDVTLDEKPDIIVMDVSFVTIKHLIPAIKRFISPTNYLIALIKPQFEVGKMINKGVITDKKTHLDVLKNVVNYLNEESLYINKLTPSPIKGGSGNIEFISMISLNNKGYVDYLKIVESAHKKG